MRTEPQRTGFPANVGGGVDSHLSAATHGSEWEESNVMLALKYVLMIAGLGLFGSTGALTAYDIYVSEQLRRLVIRSKTNQPGTKAPTMAHS
ncbi:MAG: hypothetical protein WBE73_05700, partial [Candidatus Acidiferrum sp.]